MLNMNIDENNFLNFERVEPHKVPLTYVYDPSKKKFSSPPPIKNPGYAPETDYNEYVYND